MYPPYLLLKAHPQIPRNVPQLNAYVPDGASSLVSNFLQLSDVHQAILQAYNLFPCVLLAIGRVNSQTSIHFPPFYFRLFLTELWNRDTLILQKLDHVPFDFPVVLWRETYLLCPDCKTNYRLLLEYCQSF